MSLKTEATPDQHTFHWEVDAAIGHKSQIAELTSTKMTLSYRTTRVEFLRVFCKLEDEIWEVDDYIGISTKGFYCAITECGVPATCP